MLMRSDVPAIEELLLRLASAGLDCRRAISVTDERTDGWAGDAGDTEGEMDQLVDAYRSGVSPLWAVPGTTPTRRLHPDSDYLVELVQARWLEPIRQITHKLF